MEILGIFLGMACAILVIGMIYMQKEIDRQKLRAEEAATNNETVNAEIEKTKTETAAAIQAKEEEAARILAEKKAAEERAAREAAAKAEAARIEAEIDVFGLKLKIYKRRGEYGRQFIIPVLKPPHLHTH